MKELKNNFFLEEIEKQNEEIKNIIKKSKSLQKKTNLILTEKQEICDIELSHKNYDDFLVSFDKEILNLKNVQNEFNLSLYNNPKEKNDENLKTNLNTISLDQTNSDSEKNEMKKNFNFTQKIDHDRKQIIDIGNFTFKHSIEKSPILSGSKNSKEEYLLMNKKFEEDLQEVEKKSQLNVLLKPENPKSNKNFVNDNKQKKVFKDNKSDKKKNSEEKNGFLNKKEKTIEFNIDELNSNNSKKKNEKKSSSKKKESFYKSEKNEKLNRENSDITSLKKNFETCEIFDNKELSDIDRKFYNDKSGLTLDNILKDFEKEEKISFFKNNHHELNKRDKSENIFFSKDLEVSNKLKLERGYSEFSKNRKPNFVDEEANDSFQFMQKQAKLSKFKNSENIQEKVNIVSNKFIENIQLSNSSKKNENKDNFEDTEIFEEIEKKVHQEKVNNSETQYFDNEESIEYENLKKLIEKTRKDLESFDNSAFNK
jgi:hypothetical protein